MTIDELKVVITANTTGLKTELKKAKTEISSLGAKSLAAGKAITAGLTASGLGFGASLAGGTAAATPRVNKELGKMSKSAKGVGDTFKRQMSKATTDVNASLKTTSRKLKYMSWVASSGFKVKKKEQNDTRPAGIQFDTGEVTTDTYWEAQFLKANIRKYKEDVEKYKKELEALRINDKPYIAQLKALAEKSKGYGKDIGDKLADGIASAKGKISAAVTKIGGAIKKALKVILVAVVAAVTFGFNEVVKMNANIENLGRLLGTNAKAFVNWANTSASAFGMAKADAISYGATFANLISGFSSDTKTTTALTQQMLETSAVIASKTGRTVEDVMERMRSGMLGNTESVEDLGIYAQASAMQTTKAFKQLSNGVSWDALDHSVKQQIITLGLLEQASTKYGKTLSGGLTTQLAIFKAELHNVKTALGECVTPIVTVVLPYLTAFIKGLGTAISYVKAFMQVLFSMGGSSTDLADSTKAVSDNMSTAADGTSEVASNLAKAQKTLMGFDNINTLAAPESTSGSAAAGGGGSGGIEIPEINTGKVDTNLEKIKSKVSKFVEELKPIIDAFKNLWKAVKPLAKAVGEGFIEFCKRLIAIGKKAVPPIINGVANALKNIDPDMVKAVTIALLEVGLALKAIKIGKNILSNLALLKTNLTGLSKMQKIAISVTVAIAALEWAHIKWEKVFKDSDYEEVSDALYWMFSDIFGEGVVSRAFADVFTGWGAIFSFEYTPKEWVEGFKLWAADCWKSFKDVWDGTIFSFENTPKDWVDGFKLWAADCWKSFKDYWDKNYVQPSIIIAAHVKTKWKDLKVEWQKLVENVKDEIAEFKAEVKTKWSDLKGKWDALKGNATGKTADFKAKVATKWSDLSSKYKELKNGFKGKIVDFKVKLSTSVGSVKNFVNQLINAINKNVIAKLDFNIKAPKWLGGKKFGWTAPRIPKLARGGIVDSGQMFIAGEAGKEAIMPLENNTGWIKQLAGQINSQGGLTESKIEKAFANALNKVNTGDTVLYLGNEEVARASNKGNKMINRRYKLITE